MRVPLRLLTGLGLMCALVCSLQAQERSDDAAWVAVESAEVPVPTDAAATGESAVLPVYRASTGLALMTAAERANAVIEIELMGAVSPAARAAATGVSLLWNGGKYEAAQRALEALEQDWPELQIGIANTWRTPMAAPVEKFGTDVRIGTRDSVSLVTLDIHRASGNLFAVVLSHGDGYQSRFVVYLSTNDGASWAETFWFAYNTFDISDMDMAVVDDWCYVTWLGAFSTYLRRFGYDDGYSDTFDGGASTVTVFSTISPDTLREVSLVSNQDYWDHRLYLSAFDKTGKLHFYWDTPVATSWETIATGVTNAERGLDLCVNEDFSDYFVFCAYMNANDSVCVRGLDQTNVFTQVLGKPVGGSWPDAVAVGAYRDTVHTFFEYYSGDHYYCRYYVSYNSGSTWAVGHVDDTTAISECPALTARDGGGVAMLYRQYSEPREGRMVWRKYRGWPWPVMRTYSDHQPYYDNPAVEYLGDGRYGVVYTSWNSPHDRAAYFDQGSGCCVGDVVGNVDGSAGDEVTMGDLTVLIDHLFITYTPLACLDEGNTDMSADGQVTMGDLTVMIDHLFITYNPLPACP